MASFFGVQTFKTVDINEKHDPNSDRTVVHVFSSKNDLQFWLQSDMNRYLDYKISDVYKRRFISEKDAIRLRQSGAFFSKQSLKSNCALSGAFAHISHPKFRKHYGIVVKFENQKQLKGFIDRNKFYYQSEIEKLKNTDPRVLASKSNAAALLYRNDTNIDSLVKVAYSKYPQLNPATRFLAMVSQKGDPKTARNRYSSPEVYSFRNKFLRNSFVNKVNSLKNVPVIADLLPNFSKIAINAAHFDKILEGTLEQHIQSFKEYLVINNGLDPNALKKSSISPISQKEFVLSYLSGNKDFSNKDLRQVNLTGIHLKGLDFRNSNLSGKVLDGMDFSDVKASGADFSKCTINGTLFNRSDLSSASFEGSKAGFSAPSFQSAVLKKADMAYTDLPGSDFRGANLNSANFYKSNLEGVKTVSAGLKGTQFNSCNLSKAIMDKDLSFYKTTSFKGAVLKGSSINDFAGFQQAKQSQKAKPHNQLPGKSR